MNDIKSVKSETTRARKKSKAWRHETTPAQAVAMIATGECLRSKQILSRQGHEVADDLLLRAMISRLYKLEYDCSLDDDDYRQPMVEASVNLRTYLEGLLKENIMGGLIFLEPRATFDSMILGLSDKGLVYDQDALIEHWEKEFSGSAKDEDEAHLMAVEWFDCNFSGAYCGEGTPSSDASYTADMYENDVHVMKQIAERFIEIEKSLDPNDPAELKLINQSIELRTYINKTLRAARDEQRANSGTPT